MSGREVVEARLYELIQENSDYGQWASQLIGGWGAPDDVEALLTNLTSAFLASPELPALLVDGRRAEIVDAMARAIFTTRYEREWVQGSPATLKEADEALDALLACWLPVSPEPRDKEG